MVKKSQLSFWYHAVQGVQTLPWLLNQVEDVEADSVGIEMNRGHYSSEYLLACLKRKLPFNLGTSLNLKFVYTALELINAD